MDVAAEEDLEEEQVARSVGHEAPSLVLGYRSFLAGNVDLGAVAAASVVDVARVT